MALKHVAQVHCSEGQCSTHSARTRLTATPRAKVNWWESIREIRKHKGTPRALWPLGDIPSDCTTGREVLCLVGTMNWEGIRTKSLEMRTGGYTSLVSTLNATCAVGRSAISLNVSLHYTSCALLGSTSPWFQSFDPCNIMAAAYATLWINVSPPDSESRCQDYIPGCARASTMTLSLQGAHNFSVRIQWAHAGEGVRMIPFAIAR